MKLYVIGIYSIAAILLFSIIIYCQTNPRCRPDVIMIYFMMIVMAVTCGTRIIFTIIIPSASSISIITIIRDHHFHYSVYSLCLLLLYSLLSLYPLCPSAFSSHISPIVRPYLCVCIHKLIIVMTHGLCKIIIILSINYIISRVILQFLLNFLFVIFTFFFFSKIYQHEYPLPNL